jgi:DNA repair protein SbcC/Rad50
VRITRVELENIKSYRRASIPLGAGTIAIRGHNGAGKSTLVEAIGFALFDALGYSQEQFVREGERYGTVTISFLSALDGREYQVVRRCGTASAWYVYDPEIGARVAEQRQDVLDFLRRHLRLETDIKLADLFTDALGVPQGTFTADFLLTPANRKKKFDTLLQVEDYRRAAEKLNDTRNYLVDQRRDAEARIADLERETGQLDGWRDQLEARRADERRLAADLLLVQAEAAQVEAQLKALREQEAEVARLAGAMQVAAATAAAAEGRLRDAAARVDEARAAVQVCEATRLDHAGHLTAQAQLDAANARARTRDDLTQQRAAAAQRHEGTARDLHHAEARLTEAQQAAQRLVELMPAVTRQGELEREREAVKASVQQLEAARRALLTAEHDLAQAADEVADAERQIAALEAQRPEAALLDERREHVAMLQSIRAQRTEREKRHAAALRELEQERKARERAEQAEAKAREWVRRIRVNAALAEELPALEARAAELDTEVRRLEARLEQHTLSRQQSGAGNCPFLREPCLNIRQKGMNSLGAYFDGLLAEDERTLAPLRAQHDELAPQLAKARQVRPHWERLGEYEESHAQALTTLAHAEERVLALEAERDEIAEWLRSAPGEREIADAQALFKQSDEADKQLRRHGPLQAQRTSAGARHARLAATQQEQRQFAAALETTPQRLAAIEGELAALSDPKAEAAGQQRVAAERPQREAQHSELARQVAALQQQLAELDEALAPFAGLDAELVALRAALERTREGYTRYLQHEQTAARLAEHEATAAQAGREAESAGAAAARAAAAHRRAASAFDADELARVSGRVDALGAERGRITEELRYTQAEGVRLQGEIARVEALLGDLQTARAERTELAEVETLLQQFRDTIKEAGPNIMKALLRQISTEANRIFGDVMGDRAAQLAWENDYEIVLRRDGKERAFAQLSGGEQMSAALAVRLALLHSLTRLSLAFFDEPTQNMDGERRGNLAEQIRRVRGFDQLIVISHDDTFEQGLDSVIYLEKRNGETMLMTEDALVAV